MATHAPTIATFPLQKRAGPGRRQFVRSVGWLVNSGGRGRVRGAVQVKPDTPVARWCYLYSDRDHMLVQVQRSDPVTGAFDFQNLHMDATYTVVVYDDTGTYRAEAHDGLVPEAMP